MFYRPFLLQFITSEKFRPLKYIKSFYGAAPRTKFNLGRTDCNRKGLKDGY
nr:MAG TPA: hypothetical protein [Caudoviricetes sp.]